MKFLHLGDLHIGKSVNGISMLEEQRHVFEQIIEYIRAEQPDAIVIAGDIYDRAVPGIEAVSLFDDFLTELAEENAAVLLISGNHDSRERLNFASRLLAASGLFICGTFDDGIRRVSLQDEYGEADFWLLPFIKPSSVRGLPGGKNAQNYSEALGVALKAAKIDFTKRNVLVSHQFFTKAGVRIVRSDSEINPIGGLDAIDIRAVKEFDYVALGHLHRTQAIGNEKIRYVGSPLKYSFSEIDQEKSVALVELGKKGDLKVTLLPLVPIHDMREIKGELEKLLDEEFSSTGDREDYLRVVLTDEEELIDPMGKLRSVYPNVMGLSFSNSRKDAETFVEIDAESISKRSAFDLFSEFFLDVSGATMSERQAALVRELLEGRESG